MQELLCLWHHHDHNPIPTILMIWELTVELNNLFSLADRVLADASVRAKVTLGILCVKHAHSLIKTKLHNFLDLFQLFDD